MVAFLHMGDLVAPGDHHAGCLVPQQGGEDGWGTTVGALGSAMDLVQLRVTDTAGEKLDQDLIRFRIRERDVIND